MKHEVEELMWHGVAQAAAMAQVLRTCTMATIVEKRKNTSTGMSKPEDRTRVMPARVPAAHARERERHTAEAMAAKAMQLGKEGSSEESSSESSLASSND